MYASLVMSDERVLVYLSDSVYLCRAVCAACCVCVVCEMILLAAVATWV